MKSRERKSFLKIKTYLLNCLALMCALLFVSCVGQEGNYTQVHNSKLEKNEANAALFAKRVLTTIEEGKLLANDNFQFWDVAAPYLQTGYVDNSKDPRNQPKARTMSPPIIGGILTKELKLGINFKAAQVTVKQEDYPNYLIEFKQGAESLVLGLCYLEDESQFIWVLSESSYCGQELLPALGFDTPAGESLDFVVYPTDKLKAVLDSLGISRKIKSIESFKP